MRVLPENGWIAAKFSRGARQGIRGTGIAGGFAQIAHLVEVEIGGVHGGSFRRQRGKEAAGKVQAVDRFAKFRAIGAVPGDDRVEGAELVEQARGRVGNTQQVEAGGGDRSYAVGEAHQGDDGRGRPNLEVIGPQRLQGRQRDNEIADRAGPDDKSSHHPQYAKNRKCEVRFIHSEFNGKPM